MSQNDDDYKKIGKVWFKRKICTKNMAIHLCNCCSVKSEYSQQL